MKVLLLNFSLFFNSCSFKAGISMEEENRWKFNYAPRAGDDSFENSRKDISFGFKYIFVNSNTDIMMH